MTSEGQQYFVLININMQTEKSHNHELDKKRKENSRREEEVFLEAILSILNHLREASSIYFVLA